MFRPALRSAAPVSRTATTSLRSPPVRRFLSTAPPHKKSRSWKSSVARWGTAAGLVYWYNTAVVFAEEPTHATNAPPELSRETDTYPTIDAIAQQKRSASGQHDASMAATAEVTEDIEEEASQQGAFNEETGEINWDCPCLGGMAHGPCGEQFRAAFSCFVFSKEEPKGVDCIGHFKTMQNCFRDHPDIYGAELDDEEANPPPENIDTTPDASAPTSGEPAPAAASTASQALSEEIKAKRERAVAARNQVEADHGLAHETDEMVPKAWHDTKQDNREK